MSYKFKTSHAKRMSNAKYKHSNWDKVKEYQREYMRNWRKREPGKTIMRLANAAYNSKNRLALLMYTQIRNMALEDGMFGRGVKPRRVRGEWNIA